MARYVIYSTADGRIFQEGEAAPDMLQLQMNWMPSKGVIERRKDAELMVLDDDADVEQLIWDGVRLVMGVPDAETP